MAHLTVDLPKPTTPRDSYTSSKQLVDLVVLKPDLELDLDDDCIIALQSGGFAPTVERLWMGATSRNEQADSSNEDGEWERAGFTIISTDD